MENGTTVHMDVITLQESPAGRLSSWNQLIDVPKSFEIPFCLSSFAPLIDFFKIHIYFSSIQSVLCNDTDFSRLSLGMLLFYLA